MEGQRLVDEFLLVTPLLFSIIFGPVYVYPFSLLVLLYFLIRYDDAFLDLRYKIRNYNEVVRELRERKKFLLLCLFEVWVIVSVSLLQAFQFEEPEPILFVYPMTALTVSLIVKNTIDSSRFLVNVYIVD